MTDIIKLLLNVRIQRAINLALLEHYSSTKNLYNPQSTRLDSRVETAIMLCKSPNLRPGASLDKKIVQNQKQKIQQSAFT